MESDLKIFIERAVNRLGGNVKIHMRRTKNSECLREAPHIIITAFEKIFKCDNEIEKHGKGNKVRCNFPRLSETARCPYCGDAKRQKAIIYKVPVAEMG